MRNILADLLKVNQQRHTSEKEIAGVYVSLGEKDKAMEWLEKAYERHAGILFGDKSTLVSMIFAQIPDFRPC